VQVCHFEDHVVFGVVVQDAGAAPVGDRGEQQIRGRKAIRGLLAVSRLP
jgi:hypothetical protein